MPKLKRTCPKKNEKQLESMGQSGGCKGGGRDLWKRGVLSVEWKREGVMDGDSGEGNDELTCVRSDKSDKSS